ncbi:hypothetical protein ABW19_dt0204830 [Dactylella cylindrospora]|nr:hypothetical protein ABW19_dt0204830 [Dactylella cylindrospora]
MAYIKPLADQIYSPLALRDIEEYIQGGGPTFVAHTDAVKGFNDGYTTAVYSPPSHQSAISDHPMTPTSPYAFQDSQAPGQVSPFHNLPRSCTEGYIHGTNISQHAATQYSQNIRVICSNSPSQTLVAGACLDSPGELSNCSTATSGASVDYFYRDPVTQTGIDTMPQIVNQGNVTLFMQQPAPQESMPHPVDDQNLNGLPIAVISSQQQPNTGIWYGYSQFDQPQFPNGDQRLYYDNTSVEAIPESKQQSEVMLHPLITPRASLC